MIFFLFELVKERFFAESLPMKMVGSRPVYVTSLSTVVNSCGLRIGDKPDRARELRTKEH